MFTIKHKNPDGSEFIVGPFESVELVRDNERTLDWVVRGLKGSNNGSYQVGPVTTRTAGDSDAVVWVMNETGATVARYLL